MISLRYVTIAVVTIAVLPTIALAQLSSPNFRLDGVNVGGPRTGTATSTNFTAGMAPGPVYIFETSTTTEDPTPSNGGNSEESESATTSSDDTAVTAAPPGALPSSPSPDSSPASPPTAPSGDVEETPNAGSESDTGSSDGDGETTSPGGGGRVKPTTPNDRVPERSFSDDSPETPGAIFKTTIDTITRRVAEVVTTVADPLQSVAVASEPILTPLGLASGGFSTLFAVAQAPFSIVDIGRVASRGVSNLFALFVFWRRRKPWGTVFDSRNKAPLDPAYVELFDKQGEKVAEAITDLDGRYGFLVPEGEYELKVQRANYSFPSHYQPAFGIDPLYSNLYYGGPIDVKAAVTHDIPMDQVSYDWNQEEKFRTDQMRYYHWLDPLVARLLAALFYVGLALMVWQFVSEQTVLAGILLAVYIMLLVLRITRGAPPVYGTLVLHGRPLSYALVRVIGQHGTVLSKVADVRGRYIALVPPDTYTLRIEERIGEDEYQVCYEGPIDASSGVINRTFRLPLSAENL